MAAASEPDDDSMVRYGGVVGDYKTDNVEHKAIIAAPSLVTK